MSQWATISAATPVIGGLATEAIAKAIGAADIR
jgi:hypothetical protein